MTDCPICCEEFTAKTRAPIVCGHCDFAACKQCVRKFSVNPDSFVEPHCMNCKGKWDRSFFKEAVNNSWFNGSHGYKQHMKNGLFNIEQARFPETMEAVTNYVSIPQIQQENKVMKSEIDILRQKINDISYKIYINNRNIGRFQEGLPAETSKHEKKKEKKVFIHRCPAEGCLGFLSSSWKCGICNVWACSKCGEIKGHVTKDKTKEQLDEEHVCKPANIESMNLIKKETKPCPDCAVPIFKISGCDQMWCTQCHIAFSWNTGRKITNGTIHNPHFYAWARENNTTARRVVGEVACGGLPHSQNFQRVVLDFICKFAPIEMKRMYFTDIQQKQIRSVFKYKELCKDIGCNTDDGIVLLSFTSSRLFQKPEHELQVVNRQKQIDNLYKLLFLDFVINSDRYYRRLVHFRAVELDDLRRDCQRRENNNMLRIKYLAKEITKKEFETKLLSIDKKRRKKTAILELFELVNTVYTETFIDILNLMRECVNSENKEYSNKMIRLINNFKRIIRITVYANKQLRKISSEFGLCVPHIQFNLNMYNGTWKSSVRTNKTKLLEINEKEEDTIELKNWLALNQVQTLFNHQTIQKHPVSNCMYIQNMIKKIFGSPDDVIFNVNSIINVKIMGTRLVFKAPIPIILLKTFGVYFVKRFKYQSISNIKNITMNMKNRRLVENNNVRFHGQEKNEKDFKIYEKAWNSYKEIMNVINSKKTPFNRNVQCENGFNIKWYEENMLPKIIA